MTAEGEGLALALDRSSVSVDVATLRPGHDEPFEPSCWKGSLVMVQTGALRLHCQSGRAAVFTAGSVLYLDRLPLASLGADGNEATVLVILHPAPRQERGA